jgi:translocator protein
MTLAKPVNTQATPTPVRAMAFWVLATWVAAALGAYASVNAAGYYQGLIQPPWAPPPAVFGPVWSVLYTLMAVAAAQVVRQLGPQAARKAMAFYGAQLVANALWTWIFFHWHLGAWALVEILLLLVLVAFTTHSFWRVRPLWGGMLLPYLLWVAFASALTWSLWRLNPGVL